MVLLNSDIEALPGWLAACSTRTSRGEDIGIVGARLLYPDGRIQFGGTVRNRDAPEWFDHRYRFKPRRLGPGPDPRPGARRHRRVHVPDARACSTRVGPLDERYPMAYEDVDWCLRAWQAGLPRASTSPPRAWSTTSR